jgi:hypothetical protein
MLSYTFPLSKNDQCQAAFKSQNYAFLFSILFWDLSALSLH